MRKQLLTIALLFVSVMAWAQVDARKVDVVCHAIAQAEGYYVKGSIPNRYFNPGDLKSRPGLTPLPGQKRIGKAGHIVFVNNEAGWNALRAYITKIAQGESRRYPASPSMAQLSRVYAQRWRPWLRIVIASLRIDANTRLADLVAEDENSLDSFDERCYTF